MARTHYHTLHIAPDAPETVIRAAYKTLAQTYHPDRNPSPEAAAAMTAVNEAYRSNTGSVSNESIAP